MNRLRPLGPPRDELPAVLPTETILATSPTATFALTAINVYSTSCLLDVDWVLRRSPDVDWTGELLENVLFRPFGRVRPSEPEPPIGHLVCTAEPAPLSLHDAGGGTANTGGTGDCYGHSHLHLWPLPPPGDLRLTLGWPAFGLHNAVTILDATAITEAARQVRQL
jgi:hypothetical protein